MMKAFEHWFGPYPFYEDGFKLIEVPYLGMEHQSAVTYGNGYQNGYLGRDLSGTGWGLEFDFIIIHEAGHEWFANNITYRDVADMWIHESFTNYSESLFFGLPFWERGRTGICARNPNEYCQSKSDYWDLWSESTRLGRYVLQGRKTCSTPFGKSLRMMKNGEVFFGD